MVKLDINQITLFGVGVSLIVGTYNAVISRKNVKHSNYINTVTSSRIKWINTIRDDVTSLIAILNHIIIHTTKLLDILDERTLVASMIKPDIEEERLHMLEKKLNKLKEFTKTLESKSGPEKNKQHPYKKKYIIQVKEMK